MSPAIRTELEDIRNFCHWVGLYGVSLFIEASLRGRAWELLNAEIEIVDLRAAMLWAAPQNRTVFELLICLENRVHAARNSIGRAA